MLTRPLRPLLIAAVILLLLVPLMRAGDLTPAEIGQIETDLGITLSAAEIQELGALVKPDAPLAQWRIEAEQRIAAERMADLRIEVLDRDGQPFSGAQVRLRLLSNAFNFGGPEQLPEAEAAQRQRAAASGVFRMGSRARAARARSPADLAGQCRQQSSARQYPVGR
jgi:hypothetical protein